jgi:predicted porin
MNKTLLATAIVATMACGSTLAQSGVTLYGNVDASVVTATGIGTTSDRRNSFGEGNWAPSVWGVKGTEDLGGGMRAHFRVEGGFSSANGAIANGGTTGVFSRQANVGLSGMFGSVTAGLNLSPFIAAYTSTLGLAGQNFYVPALLLHRDGSVLNSSLAPVPAFPGGTDADPSLGTTGGFFIPNSVTYSLPSEMLGGVTASVMYGFGGVPGDSGRNRFVSGNVGYSFGDLNIMAAASDRDAQYKQYLIGASVPVGQFKFAANIIRFSPEIGPSSNTWMVGAHMKMMPNASLGVNYARNDGVGDPSIINVSAVYALSKTTNLYAALNRGTDGAPSSYSGSVDATADPTLVQTGSSNAVIVGIQKGF